MDFSVADTRIGSSELGDFQYARFILWAFLVRQSKGGFIRNIAVARTEANEPSIQQMTEFYCAAYGLSEEELLRKVLEADALGKSSVELHRQLEAESSGDTSILPKRSSKKRGRKPGQKPNKSDGEDDEDV